MSKYNWVPIAEKARKEKFIPLDGLKIVCLARWEDEVAKLDKRGGYIVPSQEYYKGYREAIRDILGDLRIDYPKMAYVTRHKKTKGVVWGKWQ